jgi:hypothetical protein
VRKTAARLMASFPDQRPGREQTPVLGGQDRIRMLPERVLVRHVGRCQSRPGPARSGTPRAAWALLGSVVVMMDLLKRWVMRCTDSRISTGVVQATGRAGPEPEGDVQHPGP